MRCRNRLASLLTFLFALAAARQTPAQVVLSGSVAVFNSVQIASGHTINFASVGAMICTTSSFGFVPQGGQANEYGSPGVPEYGDAAIHDALAEGANYQSGFWDGMSGLISSTAANNPNSNLALGWIDNSIGLYTTFRGVSVNSSQSIIEVTYYGDSLLQGAVTYADYQLMNIDYGKTTSIYGNPFGGAEWIDGDSDQGGVVDADDYALMLSAYGSPSLYPPPILPVVPGPRLAALLGGVEAPEPATIGLLAAAAACGLCVGLVRRWRKGT